MPLPQSAPLPSAQRLKILDLGGLADGIARLPSGEVVLVAGGLPGDEATVRFISRTKGVLRAVIETLHHPCAERTSPVCSAFGQCGGCDLQHLNLDAQRLHKLNWLQRALGRGAPTARLAPVVQPVGHRRRARLHLRKVGRGMGLGLLQARSDELAFINTCAALDPQLEALRRHVPPLLAQAIDTGELTAVLGKQGVIAALSGRPNRDLDFDLARQLTAERLAADWGLAGLTVQIGRFEDHFGLTEVELPEVNDRLAVRVDARGFCQASAEANSQIRAQLAEQLAALGRFDRIQEWYAGSGNLTALLLPYAPRVRAIESDLGACDRLQRSLDAAGVATQVEVVCSPVEQALSLPRGRELWLLDPGRPGARDLAEQAAAVPPEAILYVSCALDTLARDLKMIQQGGMRIADAVLIDAFPWTIHAEAVVTLVRDGGAANPASAAG